MISNARLNQLFEMSRPKAGTNINKAQIDTRERILRAAWLGIEKYPHAHTSLLNALEELLHPPETIILRGDTAEITAWAQELHKLFAPRRMVLAVPADAAELPAALQNKPSGGNSVAFVCLGSTCSAPIDSLSGLVNRLRAAAQCKERPGSHPSNHEV